MQEGGKEGVERPKSGQKTEKTSQEGSLPESTNEHRITKSRPRLKNNKIPDTVQCLLVSL